MTLPLPKRVSRWEKSAQTDGDYHHFNRVGSCIAACGLKFSSFERWAESPDAPDDQKCEACKVAIGIRPLHPRRWDDE